MGASARRSRRSSEDKTSTGIQIPRSKRYRNSRRNQRKKYNDEDRNDVTLDTYVPVEKPKYPESVLGVARFENEKKQDKYQSSKR
jgi:hypothetical protein